MKVGFFSARFPYSQPVQDYSCGGSILAAYNTAKSLSQRNFETIVFTTSQNSKYQVENHENLVVYRYGTNFRLLSTSISSDLFTKPLGHEVDIAHVHFDIPPGPLSGLIYSSRKDVPLVVTYHGDWAGNYGGIIRKLGIEMMNRYAVDRLLSAADIIISPSKCYISRSRFLRRYAKKTVTIPNGIRLEDFCVPYSKLECRDKLGLPLDKYILLFLGNLSPYKGPDVLVKAMKILSKKFLNIELIVAGAGPMKIELEKLSRNLGINDNIRFLGRIDEIIKPILYKSSDVFVLPSVMDTESFGIVNLEAAASGIPIVASDIGGIPDIVIDGKNGKLFPPGDTVLLSNAITRLLENEDLRRDMGRRGSSMAKNYSWEIVTRDLVKVYSNLC